MGLLLDFGKGLGVVGLLPGSMEASLETEACLGWTGA